MRMSSSKIIIRCAAALMLLASSAAFGVEVNADPSNYLTVIGALQPGDTVDLAAGSYVNDMPINNLNGTSAAWITIQGPSSGAPAILLADDSNNTIELNNSSFLAIKNLTLEGQNLDGPFGVSAHNGTSNRVHDILIENCTIQNYSGSQQTDGISTKTPAWNWTIRNNRILNCGTGIYLGNSDGSDPFVAGVIENNLIQNPIGYCMEIKFQNPWPSVPGIPTAASSTLIRNNVFIKNDAPSPDGDRPNLLVGGFPDSGPGSTNRYEIYGNLFDHNPRESLLQVSGRVTIHDNIFVDVADTAIAAQNQDLPLKLAYIYNNTFYAAGTGIRFSNTATQGDNVSGNLVFATTPITGPITNLSNNVTDTAANAANYVAAPSITLDAMNFYPLPGTCTGAALDLSAFTNDTDYQFDFNGASKGSFTTRGAYAGSGMNPGWQLQAGNKPVPATPAPPSITSGPVATPNPAEAGQNVTFTAAASSPIASALTYAWTFGDGAAASGASVQHAYAAAGIFNATVTVTDADTLSVSATIAVTVSASGSGPSGGSGGSGGTGGQGGPSGGGGSGVGGGGGAGGGSGIAPLALTVSKLSGAFTFKGGRDSIRISGSLPGVAALFDPNGKTVSISINAASVSFVLDAHGRASSPNGTLALKLARTRNPATHQIGFPGGSVPFTATLKNGSWASALNIDPDSTAKRQSGQLTATVQLAGQPYTATVPVTFQIKAGSGGTFKK